MKMMTPTTRTTRVPTAPPMAAATTVKQDIKNASHTFPFVFLFCRNNNVMYFLKKKFIWKESLQIIENGRQMAVLRPILYNRKGQIGRM